MAQSQPGSSLRSRPKELWESPSPFLALPSSSSHHTLPVSDLLQQEAVIRLAVGRTGWSCSNIVNEKGNFTSRPGKENVLLLSLILQYIGAS